MTVNQQSLGFGLLVGQKKSPEEVTLILRKGVILQTSIITFALLHTQSHMTYPSLKGILS